MSEDSLLSRLVGLELSGVVFVRDYLQLQFNPPPVFNVYSSCIVSTQGRSTTLGETDFANAIIALVGKEIAQAHVVEEEIQLRFADNSTIRIPFAEGTFIGAEAAYLSFWEVFEVWPR